MSHSSSVPRAPWPVTPQGIAEVDHAITSRRSMRAFLPTEVPRALIEEILTVASRAPSGSNTQPWRVHVLTGASRQGLIDQITASYNDPAQAGQHKAEYDYYPPQWVSPYIERRRKVGLDLYGLLGIGKDEKQRMHAQQGRNYAFFDAPVGLIFTIDRLMGKGSWLDYGMFLQSIMVAARARGLDTCAQAAFGHYHTIVSACLQLDAQKEMVVVGMALGYADPDALDNTLLSERAPLPEFVQFRE
jgi:nitroreductase